MNRYVFASFCLFLFLFSFALPLHAQHLTWEECVREVWKNNPKLKASQHGVSASEYNVSEARAGFWPDLTVSGDIERIRDAARRPSQDIVNSQNYGTKITLEIFSGFETLAKVRGAKAELSKSQAALAQSRVGILSDLRRGFSELLFAQENIKLSEEIEKRLRKNADFLKLRYEGGREARWVYLKGKADWGDAQWDVRKTQRDLEIAQSQLAEVLGADDLKNIKITGTFEIKKMKTYKELLEEVVTHHPDGVFQKHQKGVAKAAILEKKSDFFPTVTLFGEYDYFRITETDSRKRSAIGVEMSLPLFSGFETLSATREARENFIKEDYTLRQTQLRIIKDFKKAYDDYESAVQRVEVDYDLLKAAEERALIVQKEYLGGLKEFLDWEQSQAILTQAQKRYLQAQRDALTKLADLERAQGKELPKV